MGAPPLSPRNTTQADFIHERTPSDNGSLVMVVIGSVVVVVVSEGGVVGDGVEGRVNGRATVNLQWGCGEMGA